MHRRASLHYSNFFFHPLFITIIIWIISIPLIPLTVSKYQIKHISDDYTPFSKKIFNDLNSDGTSEQVFVTLADTNRTEILVSTDKGIIDQYNIRHRVYYSKYLYIDDYNRNGNKEIYVFTLSNDSIFLTIFEPTGAPGYIVNCRFIDLWRESANSIYKPEIFPIGLIDDDNSNAFFFIITTGFIKQPRNVYKYSVKEDILTKSPRSGFTILNSSLWDINKDSKPEILISGHATGNLDESFPYSDQYNWLMVLDARLDFLFEPIKIGKFPSELQLIPIMKDNVPYLLTFYNYKGTDTASISGFYLYNIQGSNIQEMRVSNYDYECSGVLQCDESSFFFIKSRKAETFKYDNNFKIIGNMKMPGISSSKPLALLDINLDGKNEYIFAGKDYGSFVIVQDDLLHPTEYGPVNIQGWTDFSVKTKSGTEPLLYVQFEDHGSYFRFRKNPLFYLKYPFYLALFFAYYLIIWTVARLQKYRLELKAETEKKIASLQILAIKNQIDPHFTLNVLNSIGSLYATGKNLEKADYFFGKYAKLIRDTVISSEKVIITIEEELEFVRNYIDLEQFRYDNAFDYKIDIEDEFDLKIKIPRMLIHTFVENALKYNLRRGGFLSIFLKNTEEEHVMIIEDSGTHFRQDADFGTGKGLPIVEELISLYQRLENIKIKFTIDDIITGKNSLTGKRVVITLGD